MTVLLINNISIINMYYVDTCKCHMSRVTTFLPEDSPHEAEHMADYNNMYTIL